MGDAQPAPPPLTPEQRLQAEVLWRQAERYRIEGVSMTLLSTAGKPWRLRPVGRPVDLSAADDTRQLPKTVVG